MPDRNVLIIQCVLAAVAILTNSMLVAQESDRDELKAERFMVCSVIFDHVVPVMEQTGVKEETTELIRKSATEFRQVAVSLSDNIHVENIALAEQRKLIEKLDANEEEALSYLFRTAAECDVIMKSELSPMINEDNS